ncbi:MAG: hypothetical protein JO270_03750, partial [Acidobacteriaceae bacterium]|nr:hypothetical protein [Acidobacteriaceae bacterium]
LPDAIPIGRVRTLVVDASGNLWILLQNTQVFRYRDRKFEFMRGWTESGTAMARATSGAVLLSSVGAETLTYSDNRFRSLSSPTRSDMGRLAKSDAPMERTTPFSWFDRLGAPTSMVISMAQTDDGRIWLGTEHRGLFYLQDGRVASASSGRDEMQINCLLALQKSELWVGTEKGLLRWDGRDLRSAATPATLHNLNVLSILRDRDSNIWVGTSRGLFRYNTNGVSLLSSQGTTGPVTALFEDREGNIWIGSGRSLERLRDSVFVTYSLPQLESESMGPLHVDSGGRTWIAPIHGGLRWLKDGENGAVTADGIGNDVVYSIAGSGTDDIWVGRQRGGLTHLHYSGNSFTARTYTQKEGLAQNGVYAVYQGYDSTIWAGTLSGGVSRLHDGKFQTFTIADGLASNNVNAIVEDHTGAMWFGTPDGLSLLSNGDWKTYGVKEGLASASVDCLTEDTDGVLWIGSDAGLAYLRNGRVTVPKALPPPLRDMILGVAADRTGMLWVATSAHVVQVDRNRLLQGALRAGDVHIYGLADGLRGTEGVKRCRSVVADPLGRIWFSLNRGISVVHPEHLPSFPAVLPHVEAVSVDGASLDLAGPLRISSAQQRITFHYGALSLSSRDAVKYRYMLTAFEEGWSEPVTAREASYTNLRPGSYRFRLLAGIGDDLQNQAEATLPITIQPQFWQTWWFLPACGLAFLFLVLAAFRIRIYQVKQRYSIRLEERVEERTRIARELHDTLLQSFQGLLLEFQAARNLLPRRPEDAARSLDEAIGGAEAAITEGRDAIQDIRSGSDVRSDLAHLLRAAGKELSGAQASSGSGAAFCLRVEGTPHTLPPVLQDEIYRMGREILRNAFHHARAKRIEAQLCYEDRMLRLRIRDDGIGVDRNVIASGARAGHWGLPGVRERARLIGAQLDFWSEAGRGTEVQITVPASIAYRKSRNDRGFGLFRRVKTSHGD